MKSCTKKHHHWLSILYIPSPYHERSSLDPWIRLDPWLWLEQWSRGNATYCAPYECDLQRSHFYCQIPFFQVLEIKRITYFKKEIKSLALEHVIYLYNQNLRFQLHVFKGYKLRYSTNYFLTSSLNYEFLGFHKKMASVHIRWLCSK